MHLGSCLSGVSRKGVWVIGFTTGDVEGEVKKKIKKKW